VTRDDGTRKDRPVAREKHVYLRDRMERLADVLFGLVLNVPLVLYWIVHGLVIVPIIMLITKIASLRAEKKTGND
jgi:hypothetical protein